LKESIVNSLSSEQRDQFYAEGYLVIKDVIDVEQFLNPLVEDFSDRLDQLAMTLFAEGRVSSAYRGMEFRQRLTQIYSEVGGDFSQHFDFSLPLRSDITPDQPCYFPSSVFNILRHPGILDIIESLIGPEIYSNPVQHVRLKPPEALVPDLDPAGRNDPNKGMVGATDWHQDAGVVVEEADDTEIITVWTPIYDSTIENGCLKVAPRSHQAGLLEHCPRGRYLLPRYFDADSAIPLPMRRGSILLMTRTTPHCALPNKSSEMRWSMDLRYNPTGMPTGRPEFPGFVARSRSNPSTELRDAAEWKNAWLQARERIAEQHAEVSFARVWSGAGCA
jgi:ectoine hydroxylase-related dioxygenase (phytanoyl-CoA dioxygenase family)